MKRGLIVDLAAPAGSLGSRLDPRDNSLNLLRLALAVVVIVSHAWPLGGFGREPELGGMTLGKWAVAGFFALSGWLITGSRLHTHVGDFARRRLARIYPAFAVSLLAVAFLAAPLAAALGPGTYSLASALGYVQGNVLVVVTQPGIDGSLPAGPWSDIWNLPLWTLVYELACYLVIGVLVSLVPRSRLPHVVAGLWLTTTSLLVMAWATAGVNLLPVMLLAFFLSGSLLYLHRDRVPGASAWALGAAVVLGLSAAASASYAFSGVPIAYLMIWAGATTRLRLARAHDLSYGMYVYAFPVQQLLRVAGVHEWGVAAFIAISAACAFPLAAASWFLVERPALRLGRRESLQTVSPRVRRTRERSGVARARSRP